MSRADICWLGSSSLIATTGLPSIRAFVPLTDPDTDVEEFGGVSSFQALGVTAMPYPPNGKGHAEGVILRDCGGRDGVLVGGRDSRAAKVYAKLKPGDTVLHACDPEAKAQVRCHANRNLALVTEDKGGKTMLLALDGANDKIQIAAFGGIIEMSKEGGIILSVPKGDTTVVLKDGVIRLAGTLLGTPGIIAQGPCFLGMSAAGMDDPLAEFTMKSVDLLTWIAQVNTFITDLNTKLVTTGLPVIGGGGGTAKAAAPVTPPTATPDASSKVKVV